MLAAVGLLCTDHNRCVVQQLIVDLLHHLLLNAATDILYLVSQLGAGRPDQIVTAVGQLGHHLIRCSIRAGLVRILHRQRCGHTAYLSDGRIVDNLVAPLGVELFIVHHVQLYCLVTSLCHDAGRRN